MQLVDDGTGQGTKGDPPWPDFHNIPPPPPWPGFYSIHSPPPHPFHRVLYLPLFSYFSLLFLFPCFLLFFVVPCSLVFFFGDLFVPMVTWTWA